MICQRIGPVQWRLKKKKQYYIYYIIKRKYCLPRYCKGAYIHSLYGEICGIQLRNAPTSTIFCGFLSQWLFSLSNLKELFSRRKFGSKIELAQTNDYFRTFTNIIIRWRLGSSKELCFCYFFNYLCIFRHSQKWHLINSEVSTWFKL